MADEEINYVKEVLSSNWNLAFVGLMLFGMLVVNPLAFLPLLLAGEIGALFIAQNPRVQRIIRADKNKDQQIEIVAAETEIMRALPAAYQNDFQFVRRLCDEIEKRSDEMNDPGANALLSGTLERLSSFRYDYARMLRAHHSLASRNYASLDTALTREIDKSERAIKDEDSAQVRHALSQNLNVLQQRLARIRKLDELVRLLEARLQVTRNSLNLIQDEIYTFTDVAGISGLVDNLLTNLNLSDEFRSAYEDVLNEEAGVPSLAGPSLAGIEAQLPAANASWQPETNESVAPPRPPERMRRVK